MQSERRRMLTTAVVLCALACAPLTGCVAQTPSSAATGDLTGRVILKFKNEARSATAPDTLSALERACGVRVNYVRPVGAGAHLYELGGVRDQNALEQAVKTLNAQPDIDFAEIDRRMQPAGQGTAQ